MKSGIEFKNTSFLILVKDEEFFSKKLIEHINNQNINAELIIADGSKKSQKKLFERIKTNSKYYYFGEDKNIEAFFLKIYEGIKKCTKEFIFFCDQDDLVNFKVIQKHEKFLLLNKEYSAVRGEIFNFEYSKNKIKILGKQYKNLIDLNSFFFKHLLNVNFRGYYALRRKVDLIKINKLIVEYKINDFRSAEFTNDIMILGSGRVKSFDNELSVLRWSGLKERDLKNEDAHIIYKMHKTRYEWFKYFFSIKKNLIINILKNNNIFYKNFHLFRIYFFFTDIIPAILTKKIIDRIKQKLTFMSKTNFSDLDRNKFSGIFNKNK